MRNRRDQLKAVTKLDRREMFLAKAAKFLRLRRDKVSNLPVYHVYMPIKLMNPAQLRRAVEYGVETSVELETMYYLILHYYHRMAQVDITNLLTCDVDITEGILYYCNGHHINSQHFIEGVRKRVWENGLKEIYESRSTAYRYAYSEVPDTINPAVPPRQTDPPPPPVPPSLRSRKGL